MIDCLFFGLKTVGWFDVWSFSHILSGVSSGAAVRQWNEKRFACQSGINTQERHLLSSDLLTVLFLAYLWETIEHYLETGLAGSAVEFWFQGVEFSGNRIITDPALVVTGYLIAKRCPQAIWPARILQFLWLFVHVVIFPHSMYLQDFFPSF